MVGAGDAVAAAGSQVVVVARVGVGVVVEAVERVQRVVGGGAGGAATRVRGHAGRVPPRRRRRLPAGALRGRRVRLRDRGGGLGCGRHLHDVIVSACFFYPSFSPSPSPSPSSSSSASFLAREVETQDGGPGSDVDGRDGGRGGGGGRGGCGGGGEGGGDGGRGGEHGGRVVGRGGPHGVALVQGVIVQLCALVDRAVPAGHTDRQMV